MSLSQQLLNPLYGGNIYDRLGSRVVMHLDNSKTSSLTLKRGLLGINLESARGTATAPGTIHFTAPHIAAFDYRSGGKFTLALRYAPGPGMFCASPTTEHFLACKSKNNQNPGWAISVIRVSSTWYIKVYFDAYQFRSTIPFNGGTVALRWNPAATAGSRLDLFINGVKETTKVGISGTEPSAASATEITEPLILNHRYTFSSTYNSLMKADGYYTEFRYWTRELSDSQITTHHNNDTTPTHAQIIGTMGLSTGLAVSYDFEEVADGVTLTGANIRTDAVTGLQMTPRPGNAYGDWVVTTAASATATICERRNNLGSAGGYFPTPSRMAWEYKTLTTPRAGNFKNSVTNWFPNIWYTVFPLIERRAYYTGGDLDKLLNHANGCLMYSVVYNELNASEEWDFGAVVNDSAPSAYMLMGYSNFSGTYRHQLRTEKFSAGIGGGNNSNLLAAPTTATKYLINIFQAGSAMRFRITNATAGVTTEQTTGNVNTTPNFWWPSTWSGIGAGNASEVEWVGLAGNESATNNAEYGNDLIVAKNLTAAENVELERYLIARL
jgi:hypothetical protein